MPSHSQGPFRHPSPWACLAAAALAGCQVTSHPSEPTRIGTSSSTSAMEAVLEQPGPVALEKVVAADWSVSLSGLLDLEDAKAAGLEDRDEPIQIYMFALRHPERGTYLVDTGVAQGVADGSADLFNPLVARVMHTERLRVHTATAAWLADQAKPPAGVLLTHLHLDHVLGLPDVPSGTPIHVGPGEASSTALMHAFVQGINDEVLQGHAPLRELRFDADPDGVFAGVLDLFGDGSVFVLHVPGHTSGSLAFVVRTPRGPVLLTGDASHTCWGFAHGVPPGSFTEDGERGRASFLALRDLAKRHPKLRIQPGHQSFPVAQAATVLGGGDR